MSEYRDSMEKVSDYLERMVKTREIDARPSLARRFICVPNCGACCHTFTLDYIPGSLRWKRFVASYPQHVYRFTERKYNGKTILTDAQRDNKGRHCRHLNMENALCNIHLANPFSCAFEPLKIRYNHQHGKTYLLKTRFGRGWKMIRYDNNVGAMCEFPPGHLSLVERHDTVAMFRELAEIARYLHNGGPRYINARFAVTLVAGVVYGGEPA